MKKKDIIIKKIKCPCEKEVELAVELEVKVKSIEISSKGGGWRKITTAVYKPGYLVELSNVQELPPGMPHKMHTVKCVEDDPSGGEPDEKYGPFPCEFNNGTCDNLVLDPEVWQDTKDHVELGQWYWQVFEI